MLDLRSILSQLGRGDREVARTLHWAGITGRRQSTSSCPVANYVRMYCPDAFDVVVTAEDVCIWEEREDVPVMTSHVATPAPISSFVAGFDEGRYPHLDSRDFIRTRLVATTETEDPRPTPALHRPLVLV